MLSIRNRRLVNIVLIKIIIMNTIHLAALVSVYLIFFSLPSYTTAQLPGKESNTDRYLAGPYINSTDTPVENYFNSATYTKEGKTYKLILIGDLMPQLFINGERINKNELDIYQDQIDLLSKVIGDRRKKENDRINVHLLKVKNQILTDLVQKRLVNAISDVKSYYLTSRFLKVNGNIQEPATFLFFSEKYLRSEYKVYYFEAESNYTFQN